jgi:predicted SAM-dependent methyltransferase
MRLNLGSGPQAVPGWINIDRSPNIVLDRAPTFKRAMRWLGVLRDPHMTPWSRAIVRHDIRRRLPYPDGSVDAIYSSHTLEHLYLAEVRGVLAECARVLRPGGQLRLALPDAERMARDLLAALDAGNPDAGFAFNRRLLAHPEERPRGVRRLTTLASGGIHRWQPVPAMVGWLLEAAGFTQIQRRSFGAGEFPDLAAVETNPDSFFLEAIRPGLGRCDGEHVTVGHR